MELESANSDADCTVETHIGTAVIETPKYLRNPITDRREDMEKLSEDGYCRRFMALNYAATRPSVVNLDNSPVLNFDKDKWDLQETENGYILTN